MNETLKNDFYTNVYGNNYEKNLKWYIKTITKHEAIFIKDLKDFNVEEISEMLISVGSFYDVSKILSILKKYREYNLVLGNKISNLNFDDERLTLSYYRKKNHSDVKFVSNENYNKIVKMFDSENTNIATYFKGIIMCLYEGIKGKKIDDIIYLKMSDIDSNTKIVKLKSNITIKISDELYETLKIIDEMQEYTKPSGNVSKLVYSIEDGCIFKYSTQTKTSAQIQDFLRRVFERYVNDTFDIKIKFPTIYKSGLIYRFIHEFNENIDEEGYLIENVNTVTMNNQLKKLGYEGSCTKFLYQYKNEIIKCKKDRK